MLDTKLPLVSVCIPTYNGEKYLDQCLSSILSQTLLDYEIIIVDDCSSDGTLSLAKSFAKKHEFIHVFKNEHNLGLVGNWNRCLDHSSGKWIKFVFQDDWLDQNCLKEMVFAGESTAAKLVVCRRNFFFENILDKIQAEYAAFLGKHSPDHVFNGEKIITSELFCKQILSHIGINYIGEPTAVLIDRSVFYDVGKFDSDFIQLCDFELFLRIGVKYGMTYVPDTLAYFRVHQSSTTAFNSNSRAFEKEVIDTLLLVLHFCTKKYYESLRVVDSRVGFDLSREFRVRLQYAQLWGQYRYDPHWKLAVRKHPEFKLPVYLRLKRQIKKMLHH